MKKIYCAVLLCGSLFANDNLQTSSSLVKQGFDSLIVDMQKIKENNHANQVQIEALNKKFDYLISILQKKNVTHSISISHVDKLEKTIGKLEAKVMELEQQLASKSVEKVVTTTVETPKVKESIVTVEKSEDFYNPQPKKVIVSEDALDKMDENKLAAYSIQVGIFREQKSLNNAKSIYEKLIDTKNNKITFEPCTTCKNKDLTKVIIEGFESKKQAQQFVEANRLKNSMIIDNRG